MAGLLRIRHRLERFSIRDAATDVASLKVLPRKHGEGAELALVVWLRHPLGSWNFLWPKVGQCLPAHGWNEDGLTRQYL